MVMMERVGLALGCILLWWIQQLPLSIHRLVLVALVNSRISIFLGSWYISGIVDEQLFAHPSSRTSMNMDLKEKKQKRKQNGFGVVKNGPYYAILSGPFSQFSVDSRVWAIYRASNPYQERKWICSVSNCFLALGKLRLDLFFFCFFFGRWFWVVVVGALS
ncbi:hypothetical protein AMTRI_Chr02g219770 [Amborella trichopoda]